MNIKKPTIAVIGAGIAGLNLANLLSNIADVVVFEKSDKVGGRIATHNALDFSFDHGAQFFTAKSLVFKEFIKVLETHGVVAQWHANFAELDPSGVIKQRLWDEEFPHYVGTPSMSAIGNYLAKDIDVRFNELVIQIKRINSKWFLDTTSCEYGPFDWVIVCTPARQAYDILPESFNAKVCLKDVTMQPCFTLMLGYKTHKSFKWDAGFVSGSILSWVSINSSKPERDQLLTIVAMSKNDWAYENFDKEDSFILAKMLPELERIADMSLNDAHYIKIKKWKYANAFKKEVPLELIDFNMQLACCGDWCVSGRIESAFISSLQIVNKLRSVII